MWELGVGMGKRAQRLMETRAADPQRDLQARMMGKLEGLVPKQSRLAQSTSSMFGGIVDGVMGLTKPSGKSQ